MAAPFDAKQMQLTGSSTALIDGVMQSVNVPNGSVENGMGQFAFSSSGTLVYASGGTSPSFTFSIAEVDRKGVQTEIKAPKELTLRDACRLMGTNSPYLKVGPTAGFG